jgi:hypothetical protein
MRQGKLVATRFFIIVILVMTFLILGGPTLLAKKGPPIVSPEKDTEDEPIDQKNKGWEKVLEKFIEKEKIIPEHVNNPLFNYIREATKEDEEELIKMVVVGELGVSYEVPICSFFCGYWETNDNGTAIVIGGFKMATTETTYELWYKVRIWALENGYLFQNAGTEGSHGIIGAEPTEGSNQPVSSISFRDMVVWLNALSEMTGLEPVYRNTSGEIIRNSQDANASIVDNAIQTNHKGYRLPSSREWEMAAKWKNDTESTDGSIYRGNRYWTPHNYLSGATDYFRNATASNEVGWHNGNSGGHSHPVGLLIPNALGLFDMSGNLWEVTFSPLSAGRQSRGGGWENTVDHCQLGVSRYWGYHYFNYNNSGFRIVIDQ